MDFNQAVDRLAKFQTADGLARFLKREGIKSGKAVPRAYRCPLAMWLKKALGENPDSGAVVVGTHSIYFNDESRSMPQVCTAFIRRFDDNRNRYKFLRD